MGWISCLTIDKRSNLPTVVSIAVCAAVAADMVHEALGHGIVSWLVGDPILSISSVALQNASANRLVSAAGTSANLIAGLLSLWLLRRTRQANSWTLFLWLFGAFNLFNTGYLLFSAIAGGGDWGNVISGLKPELLWRALLAVLGGGLYFFSTRWLFAAAARTALRDLPRIVIASYIAAGAVMTAAACFNPIGPGLILVSGVGASFGLNGGMLYLAGAIGKTGAQTVLPFHWIWITLGVIITVLFIFVIGRGIHFAGA